MTENHIPQTSTPQAAPTAVPVTSEQTHPISQVPATVPASVTATAAAAAAAVSSMNGAGEQLPCQWVGCTEKSPTAEALYVSLTIAAMLGIAQFTNESGRYRNTCANAMSVARVPTT